MVEKKPAFVIRSPVSSADTATSGRESEAGIVNTSVFSVGIHSFFPYRVILTQTKRFSARVRYLCNLFGHQVHAVTERAGFSEYACECGHNFLKRAQRLKRVTHPLICLLVGHFVSHVEQRGSYGEYVCRNCGHTFLFAGCPTGRLVWPLDWL